MFIIFFFERARKANCKTNLMLFGEVVNCPSQRALSLRVGVHFEKIVRLSEL